jgi:hypothetical protein
VRRLRRRGNRRRPPRPGRLLRVDQLPQRGAAAAHGA